MKYSKCGCSAYSLNINIYSSFDSGCIINTQTIIINKANIQYIYRYTNRINVHHVKYIYFCISSRSIENAALSVTALYQVNAAINFMFNAQGKLATTNFTLTKACHQLVVMQHYRSVHMSAVPGIAICIDELQLSNEAVGWPRAPASCHVLAAMN